MSRLVVLGCGWTGVLVAWRLKQAYPLVDVVCVDRDTELGGLLKSVVVNGYLFDIGGSHVVFSRNKSVLRDILLLGGKWVAKRRNAYVALNGVLLPYPFENGIFVLPPEERARYGLSLIRALIESVKGEKRPSNFREWIVSTFGWEIARDYLIPYNEKIWKRPLDSISADWVYTPGRLPIPSLEDIVKAIAGLETKGYQEQAVFYYPRTGGIIEQYKAAHGKAMEIGVKSLTGIEIKEIKVINNEFIINGHIRADKVINTIPLNEFPHLLNPPPPEEVLKAASRLDYNQVIVVGLGIKRSAPPHHWVYIPEKRFIFHRYAWISNYLAEPLKNRASLIAEITLPPTTAVDKEEVINQTISGLEELDVIKENEVEVARAWIHKYGYPIYTLTHHQDRETIEIYLKQLNIITLGRWGNWHYWNTDKIYENVMRNFSTIPTNY